MTPNLLDELARIALVAQRDTPSFRDRSDCLHFLRTHAPALADMAKRMDGAERDAATERAIQKAAETLPEGYVITLYVENGSGYIDLTDPEGDPVYVKTDDMDLAEQFTEATRMAAIDATQEGEAG